MPVSGLAAAGPEAAKAFVEIGAVALALAVLARLAGRLGVTTIPFYLLAGLAVGRGGIAPLDVSADFIRLVAEIGVLLLLQRPHLGVGAAAREQLAVGAPFDDAAAIEHENLVGIHDGR